MRRRRRFSSRTATRVAFGVIVAFVLAQAVWWVWFQRDYIGRTTEARLAAWEAQARLAQRAHDEAGGDAAVREELLREHPPLAFRDGAFVVDPEERAAFVEQQRRHLRMFAYEGPFFVLVIMVLLAFIARSLREERDLKRRQQNFLSAVTHELKTPLSTLRLLIQTAQLRELTPERRRGYLERMAGEVDRLERTSEQVLAAARLEQSPEPPVLEPHDLNDAAARIVEQLRGGLEARGAQLELRTAGEPLPVSLDERAFELAVANLLDNAVKYASAPAKRVVVSLERRGDLCVLNVDDQGPGVPPEERERIFDRFYRSGDEMTRGAQGVGLGLHLVRSVAESMNGWVRVEDAPGGRGSRFAVVLPRRVARAPRSVEAAAEGAR